MSVGDEAAAQASSCIIERLTRSAGETMALAGRVAALLRPGDVVTLEGELGAGKTCFVRGLAAGLGLDPSAVSSPTFVIMHVYSGRSRDAGAGMSLNARAKARGRDAALVHLDAYRLHSADDLASVGWDEWLERSEAIVALEWPQRVAAALPDSRVAVRIEHDENGDARRITLEPLGTLRHRDWSSV